MVWSIVPLVCSICLLAWSLCRNDYAFSYATLFAGATLYFIIRGLIAADQYELVPEGTRAVASIYVATCVVCVGLGWSRPFVRLQKFFPLSERFPPVEPLVKYCVCALLFSAYFAWKLRNHLEVTDAGDLTRDGGWSGPHVIYLFLTQPGYFVTSVAAIAYVVTRKPVFAILAVVAIAVYMLPSVFAGRREKIMEAAILAGLCWTLFSKRPVPRTVLATGGVVLMLLFSSIGIYRSSIRNNVGIVEAARQAVMSGSTHDDPRQEHQEVNNYLAVVHSIVYGGRIPNFGVDYWNKLVFAYVPAQLIGREFKESLQLPDVSLTREEVRELGFRSGVGTTFTGFSDTIQAFWFLGPVAFYLLSRYVATIYALACKGSAVCLFAYPFLLIDSTLALTHSLSRPIHGTINLLVFMAFWVWWIERKGGLSSA